MSGPGTPRTKTANRSGAGFGLSGCLMTLVATVALVGFVTELVQLIAAISSNEADWQDSLMYNHLPPFLSDRSTAIAILVGVVGVLLAVSAACIAALYRAGSRELMQQTQVMLWTTGLSQTTGRIVDERVRVFASVSQNSGVLSELTPGNELKIGKGQNVNGAIWWEVTLPDGRQGYAPGGFRVFQIRKVAVRRTPANLHERADKHSPVKAICAKGDELYVLDLQGVENTVWARVRDLAGNREGFLNAEMVRLVDGQDAHLNRILTTNVLGPARYEEPTTSTVLGPAWYEEPTTSRLALAAILDLGFFAFHLFLDGLHSFALAAGIVGVVAGSLAGRPWRGTTTALMGIAQGAVLLLALDYRVFVGPMGGQLQGLSFWGSFGEMLLIGGMVATLTSVAAGAIAQSRRHRVRNT